MAIKCATLQYKYYGVASSPLVHPHCVSEQHLTYHSDFPKKLLLFLPGV